MLAGFLGWTLDAFDFFVVVFLYDTLAREFHVSKAAIILTTTATLALRPVGALIFGSAGGPLRPTRTLDGQRNLFFRHRVVLRIRVQLHCVPDFAILFGIGMGGEWGVGASLAMEAAPARWRGVLSGILQNGYAVGYLLASLA